MNKPIKHHPCFLSLSRDHHDGLLLAIRLQQGGRALLRLWSHDPRWQAEYVVRFFDDGLEKHFTIEETFLFPAVRPFIGPSHPLLARLLEEHTAMRTTIGRLRRPADPDLPSVLVEFGRMLEGHIRCEEREFFPLCERRLPAAQLDALAERMNNH
jgi:hemerythrin-like domain-containing protein